MRKLFFFLFMILLVFSLFATVQAQARISFDFDHYSVGTTIDFEIIDSPQASLIEYTLLQDGKALWKSKETLEVAGAFRPVKAGDYLFQAKITDESGTIETITQALTITDMPTATITASPEAGRTGDPFTFTVIANHFIGECHYLYTVTIGNKKLIQHESQSAEWVYTPNQSGDLQVDVVVTDEHQNTATAVAYATVAEGKGISVSGGNGVFGTFGGIQTWTVHSPGVWSAQATDDFIVLSQTCGLSEDTLTFSLTDSQGVARSGGIDIYCNGRTVHFPISQSASSGIEEEIWLSDNRPSIFAEGLTHLAWHNASNERTFAIEASANWSASCQADFVSLSTAGNELTVSLLDNHTHNSRTGVITLNCEGALASIHVFQPPKLAGADVLSVSLSANAGNAYADSIIATVFTTGDTQTLSVLADQWYEALTFNRDTDAVYIDDHLQWVVTIPLTGNGSQLLLFGANSEEGSAQKATAVVDVIGEAATFADNAASYLPQKKSLSVRVTAATDALTLLDKSKKSASTYLANQALIDYCLSDSNQGRYTQWTLPITDDFSPAYVQLGDTLIPVNTRDLSAHNFPIYSQCDGWWKNKKYRTSTLEHSGCAIFALSSALQRLGYEGDAILPEVLAQKYAACLLEGGTMNSALVGRASDDFGYRTRFDLYTNASEIIKKMNEQGALYTFSVVNGHIAMVAEVSEDKTKFRIVDSALSATFERIGNNSIYIRNGTGEFTAITSPAYIPDSRYYVETNAYGGGEYWLDVSYVARRGVRLIQPE